jgi:hypothetical protein
VWRATTITPHVAINSLQLRPWYQASYTNRQTQRWGPNLSALDHYPPIDADPEFKAWNKPVPYSWWKISEEFPILQADGTPAVTAYSRFYGRSVIETVLTPTDAGPPDDLRAQRHRDAHHHR